MYTEEYLEPSWTSTMEVFLQKWFKSPIINVQVGSKYISDKAFQLVLV